MRPLYKYAEDNLNASNSKQNMNLATPELQQNNNQAYSPETESNNLGMQAMPMTDATGIGQNNYANVGKVGTTPGYTDLWQQQSVQTTAPSFNSTQPKAPSMMPTPPTPEALPKMNSLLVDAVAQLQKTSTLARALPLIIGGGALAWGGKQIYDHTKDLKESATRRTLTKLPRALLTALAAGVGGYKLNEYTNGYINRGAASANSVRTMQNNFRRSRGVPHAAHYAGLNADLIKHAMSTGMLAALGIGTAGATVLGVPRVKDFLTTKANSMVDNKTKYWMPAALVSGLGLGYMSGDAPKVYRAHKQIKSRNDYQSAYDLLRG